MYKIKLSQKMFQLILPSLSLTPIRIFFLYLKSYTNWCPPRRRRGSGLDCGENGVFTLNLSELRNGKKKKKKTGFVSRHTLTACGPSDGTEIEDVFGRSGSVSG